ncbi:MAG: peptidylprolyl isomerase [Beijerinckiaceae bacterium]
MAIQFRVQAVRFLFLLTTTTFALSSNLEAQVVAKVEGVEITKADISLAMEDIGRTLPRQMSADQRTNYVINYLIDMALAAKEAEKEKLQDSAVFKQKVAYFRQKALMETYMDRLTKSAASPAKVEETYREAAKGHKPEAEVKASHILVPTKEEAETALKRLGGGEDFAKLAKEISKDPGSPGGSLGWFAKDKMVPSFAEMAFKTEVGKISPPVQSQFGWHIIKVEGRRVSEFPKLDKVREQIEQYLTRRTQANAIRQLRGAAKIEKFDDQK